MKFDIGRLYRTDLNHRSWVALAACPPVVFGHILFIIRLRQQTLAMTSDRKRLKRFHTPGDVHELTFSSYGGRPLLSDNAICKLLCQSIDRAMSRHRHRLVAFVLMPEHVHLLILPTSIECDIAALLFAIKRPFSHRVKQYYERTDSCLRSELTVREREGKSAFRFWQEGAGYDRNLFEPKSVLAAIDYIHLNPVRRGLVTRARDWKWSSCRWYVSDRREVDPDLPTIHGLRDELG
jgi:putative transposase